MLKKLWHGVEQVLQDISVWLILKIWRERVMVLSEEIALEDGDVLIKTFEQLARESDKPIVIVCDCDGGNLVASMAFAEVIYASRVPVVTMVFYEASSGAVRIFAAGKLRMMHRKASLGLHMSRMNDTTVEKVAQYYKMLNHPLAHDYSRQIRVANAQARRQLDKLAGQTLPDMLFRDETIFINLPKAKGLGLADGMFQHPPVEVWWKARRLKARTGNFATT